MSKDRNNTAVSSSIALWCPTLILLLLLPVLYLFAFEFAADREAANCWPAVDGYSLQKEGRKWEFTKGDNTGWPYKKVYYHVTRPGETFSISVNVDVFLRAGMWRE